MHVTAMACNMKKVCSKTRDAQEKDSHRRSFAAELEPVVVKSCSGVDLKATRALLYSSCLDGFE